MQMDLGLILQSINSFSVPKMLFGLADLKGSNLGPSLWGLILTWILKVLGVLDSN